jgi:hypothetical protein
MTGSVRFNANARASAIVAFETTSSCNPKCTIVWAICGRMPLMMQSAPMSLAADTVLMRCWATSVSTVGTPVMSMIEEVRHHRLCALAVQGTNQREGQDLVPQLHHRSREFEQLVRLAFDHLIAALRIDLERP